MIPAGDWEEHDIILEYYLRMLPLLQARTVALYPNASSGAPGAFWQTETASVFGAISEGDYHNSCGARPADLPAWLEDTPYLVRGAGGSSPNPRSGGGVTGGGLPQHTQRPY